MQKKIKFLLSLLVVLAMIVLAACGNGADTPADSNGDVSDQSGVATKSFTDSTNRVVDVPAKVERIVPSGPLTQMMMLAIAPDLMVGLSSEWAEAETFVPEQYRALPITGQLYGGKGELNLEQIAAVDSQLIVDVGEPKGTIAEDMDELTKQIGIPAVHITATLDDMAGAYRLLGQLLGREEKGEELASYCEKIYNRTLDIMDRVGEENKISILN
ncbi:MAG: ABC transporter substrate-binding protein, partial [Clostridiales bacterium]